MEFLLVADPAGQPGLLLRLLSREGGVLCLVRTRSGSVKTSAGGVTVAGKKIRLAQGRKSRPEAEQKFPRASAYSPTAAGRTDCTCGGRCGGLYSILGKAAADTYRNYRFYCQKFAEACGQLPIAEQKISIIRQHLLEKIPVSTLCDQHGISPVNFYNWQRQLFENGAMCFGRKENAANERRQESASERKISALEAKLQSKNEVIAELLEEHVQLIKANGEP